MLNRETANRTTQTPRRSPKRDLKANTSTSPRNQSFFCSVSNHDQPITPRTDTLVSKIVSEADQKEMHLNFLNSYLRIITETIDTLCLLKDFPANFSLHFNDILTDLKKHQSEISDLLNKLNDNCYLEKQNTILQTTAEPLSASPILLRLTSLGLAGFSIS